MTDSRELRAVGVLSLLLMAGSCAGGGGLPVTHYYTLTPPAEQASSSAAPEGVSIGVVSITVDPPYDQDRLVYRKGRGGAEVGFYAYHRWASPLGRMIAVALADGLSDTPGIAAIEPARSSGDYVAWLDGRLLHLEEVDSGAGQEVRLALELVLRDVDEELLWSSTLSSSATGEASEVPEVVELARSAFNEVLAQAADEIAAALRARNE